MGFLRPVRMAKVGLLALKEDQETVLTALHDLRVAQVEPISPEVLNEFLPEHGTELQKRIAEEALRFRGLATALPRLAGTTPRSFRSLDETLELARTVPIDSEVAALRREDDQLVTKERTVAETLQLLDRLAFYPDRLEYLRGHSYVSLLVEGPAKSLVPWREQQRSEGNRLTLDGPVGKLSRLLVSLPLAAAEAAVRSANDAGLKVQALPELAGTVAEAQATLREERVSMERRRSEIADRLRELSRAWYEPVASIDEALQVQARQLEILPRMASSRSAFALEAWVPARDTQRLQRALLAVTHDRVVFYERPTTETPPTLLDNPKGIRWFEFFIRFYSLPKSTEWDPTWVFALVFPVFFGLMVGDWGYGATILLICTWMLAGFPGARRLPKFGRDFIRTIMGPPTLQALARTLVPSSILAIAFGLYFDSFFGVSVLHQWFGYTPGVRPDTNLSHLLLIAGYVGLGMVTLGFALGALKEYFHHHYRGAVGKAGGIVFAWGVTFYGLGVLRHSTVPPLHSPFLWTMLVGAGALVGGEGLQNGMLGLIEVLSHILSYTRLIGILLASVILASLINGAGAGLFHTGGVSIVGGIAILFIGQSFNVILSVFEPSIQGMRLMFVEYFSKFYEGDGVEFHPFGAERTHTLPVVAADGRPVGGPGAAPAGPVRVSN